MKIHIPLRVIDECESTNSYLLENWDTEKNPFLAIIALNQTQGRGRGNNSWSFYPGNLAMSIGLKIEKGASTCLFPFLLGVSVARALKGLVKKEDLLLKWPNDIYFLRKKVGGILSQARQTDAATYLVLGLGLNLLKAPTLSNQRYQATSFLDAGIQLDAVILVEKILENFQSHMEDANILLDWQEFAGLPQAITIHDQNGIFYAYGLSHDGGLKVRSGERNEERVLYSEEITIADV